ncbi:protein-glutamate methylesterase/protein-glutamine glutaminase [Halothermothrix orenii]|uniref:Protein-glutamate methylesterase/protein-glutamine glutaminase n=1 Tax=Halothermothrix orenii (strain H 168 / OCM 544 / DSM 9562) TaxID=373903 RepID=B8CZS0_HALOH|nr:chemotaxis response regulator protein-glutamate methylesterase [Halothermothrix orenii]ACL70772.1 response regulator receiver modulated CheB methylesterase [Halothermothrix orenii H 168]
MIKVMVVDDSAFIRQIMKKTINQEDDIEVIAVARNGQECLDLIEEKHPDVITLDIDMPGKDGLEILKVLMDKYSNIPVIMLSAIDNRDTVMKALKLGAFDFIPKPSGNISLNINDVSKQLITKIKAAAGSNISCSKQGKQKATEFDHKPGDFPVIAIGSSSGGPKALKEILPVFPNNLKAALVVVQHMPPGFTASLAKRLHQESKITVKEASEYDYLQPGVALIAPGGYHLEFNPEGRVVLNQKPPKWGVRPCVDYMLKSVADIYKERVIGIILTGMGRDGAEGMKQVKKYNGYGIVEDKSTALVYGMPGATIEARAYDEILPLHQIPLKIIDLIERRK